MRLLILTAILTGAVCGVNVPTTSYVTYHGSTPNSNSYSSFEKPPSSSGASYYGSIFGKPSSSYYSQSPDPVPSQMCPISPPPCVKSRYRTLDGTCNNWQNPLWGSANMRYGRLLTPRYGDGISSPTNSITGQELPNARLVSLIVFGEEDIPDPQYTIVNMQWGQVMTHDMSMQAGGTQSRRHSTRCCTEDGKAMSSGMHATCFPILVPKNDPAHSQTKVECMNFVRTLTDRDNNCLGSSELRPAEQLTTVTAYMDLSLVYGSSEQQNRPIREFTGGRMRVENRGGDYCLLIVTNS